MAASKKNTIPTTDATGKANDGSNGPDSTTTTAIDTNKVLIGKMKAIGLDSKGLYTEWNNGALDAEGNNGAVDMIDFMVMKHKLTADDKTAILAMFAKMQLANTPKVKVIKEIPTELSEAWKLAYNARQQFYVERKQAQDAFDALWNVKQGISKDALTAARTAVETAGFYVKGDAVVATKSGSTTSDGTHGNSGKQKLSIGWTIQIGTVNYTGWKEVAEKLVPSVFKGETNTNYLSNTPILDKVIELGLPIEIWCKIALKDHDHAAALEAWGKSAAKAKLDSHPSITVHVS